MRDRSKPRFALILVAALASLSACAGGEAPEPTESEWTEPAWMAEQTQKIEEIYQSTDACLVRKGWDVPFGEDLGIETSGMSEAETELVLADWDTCLEEADYGNLEITRETLTEIFYPREVDLYECLKAHDLPVSDPPPIDVFVDTHMASLDDKDVDTWQAWDLVGESFSEPDGPEFEEVDAVCPQNLGLS